MQFFLGLFHPGHIVKHDAGFGFHLEFGAGLAKVHRLPRRIGRASHNKQQQGNGNHYKQHIADNTECLAGIAAFFDHHIHAVEPCSLNQLMVVVEQHHGLGGGAIFALEDHLGGVAEGVEFQGGHLSRLNFVEQVTVGQV